MQLDIKQQPEQQQQAKNEGFQVLKVKYNANSKVIRHLFVKQFSLSFHKNQNDDKPENRTLFIINLPPFITEHHIRYLFEKRCGSKISKIFFQEKPSSGSLTTTFNKIQSMDLIGDDEKKTDDLRKHLEEDNTIMSYKVCYVVFNKPSGLTSALQMVDSDEIYNLKPLDAKSEGLSEESFYTGIKLWKKQYNDSIVAPWQLKNVAQQLLTDYEKHSAEQEAQEKVLADMGPDEDGWITVNRKLRRNRSALVDNQFHDQKIKDKYGEKQSKRKADEADFDLKIEKSVLPMAVKKKKSKKSVEF